MCERDGARPVRDAAAYAEKVAGEQPTVHRSAHNYIDHLIIRKGKEIAVLERLKTSIPQSVNSDPAVVDYLIKLFHNHERVG